MEEMINNIINNVTNNKLLSLVTAIGIIIVFRIFASIIAYIIIKMCNLRKKLDIRKSAFYRPLKSFIIVLGVYLAVLFIRWTFGIDEKIMVIVTKIFKIIIVLLVSKGIIDSLTSQNSIIVKLQEKMSQSGENSTSTIVLIKVIKILIYIIASVIIVQELGYDLSGLIAGLGLGGVILTLAAQDTAKNLFGGMVIFLDKPFKVGDYIKLLECEGIVEDITFRSTRIRALDNTLLHIPNSEISSSIIINNSEIEKRRYKTNLTIELGTQLAKIEEVIKDIEQMLEIVEKVIPNSISVKFQNINNNGTEIVVIAYVDIVNYAEFLDKQQEINYNIMRILEANNVELAYDTQTIFLKH